MTGSRPPGAILIMKLDRESILARSPMRLNRFCVSVINKLFKIDKRPPLVTTSHNKPVNQSEVMLVPSSIPRAKAKSYPFSK